jgi:cell surface hyaluronidase
MFDLTKQACRFLSSIAAAALVLALGGISATASAQATCVVPPVGAKLWSSPGSWAAGQVPGNGSCVQIPAGTTMYLDVTTTNALAELEIHGTLIIPCGTHTLQARNILVKGSLLAGSQAAPFSGKATIRLLAGSLCDPSKEEQTLAVEGAGVLRLAGVPFAPSWTSLQSTAPALPAAPAQTLQFTAPVSWLPGQEIVIASTDFDFNQDEVRTLRSTSGSSAVVHGGLTVQHWGATEGLAFDPVGIDERAEVGLLTRSIVVEGTPYVTSNGSTSAGHVILRNPTGAGPRGELSWVQFRSLGKEGVLGKYPIHFHQLGNAAGSFVRNCSVHASVNRAIALHTTQNVDVSDNVAFDVMGHTYYFEDEPTQSCTMERNLGLGTRVSAFPVLPSDGEPSTFWLHSPNNIVRGNHAAGSQAFGFWFATDSLDPTPWGPGQFEDNVAHSNEKMGFYQDTRPQPLPESILEGCVAYKNREFGMWIRSYSETRIVNARVADNRGGFYLASEGFQWPLAHYLTNGSAFGVGRTRLQSSLVIGETANIGTPTSCDELAVGRSLPQLVPFMFGTSLPRWVALTGVEFYDGKVGVENTTFAEYRDKNVPTPGCAAPTFERKAGALAQVRYRNPWAVDPRNYVSGLTFVNSGATQTRELYFRTPVGAFTTCGGLIEDDGGIANTIIRDVDGSLTGVAGTSVFPDNPFLTPTSGSTYNSSWNARLSHDAAGQVGAPSSPYAQFELLDVNASVALPLSAVERIGVFAVNRNQWFAKADPIIDPCGPTVKRTDRFPLNLLTDEIYQVAYDPALPSSAWPRAVLASVQFTEAARWLYVTIPLVAPTTGQTLVVQLNTFPISAAADIPSLFLGPGNQYFFDTANNTMHAKLKVFGTGSGVDSGMRTTFFAGVL